MLDSNWRRLDLGLLVMRVGLGLSFMAHGWPKMIGGPAKWTSLGGVMSKVGLDFAPAFWGFMAAFAELGGGLLLALGLFFRPSCLLLFATMVVATVHHVTKGDPFSSTSHALEAAIVFAGLFLTGPGGYGVDVRLRKNRTG